MAGMSGFFRRLWLLIRRDRFRDELDEEMAFHRTQTEKSFLADGMTQKAARRAAMQQFGNPEKLKDRSTEVIGFRMETVAQDLRFAFRQLHRNPGFALTSIAILTLGIGASVAIFGFVDSALIKPLPYNDPTRLAVLFESINLGPRFHLSYLDYLDWKKENKSFSSLDVFSATNGFMLKTPEGPQRANGVHVSAGFFHTIGVVPALGRDFHPDEDTPSTPRTALLSYSAWQKRFGGRSDVLGQTIVLNGDAETIIGVLPKEFHFAPAGPAEFWVVDKAGSECEAMRGCHDFFGVARLRDGVSFASASADINVIAERLEKQYPDSNRKRGAFLMPLTEVIVGDIRPILLVLLGGSALLLMIASVNVASLLLVRSESRRREIALRGALGASTARLMRQFITEGLLLASVGGILGIGAGVETMHLMTRLMPAEILATMPYLQGLGMNLRVAAFALGICIIAALLFALTPMSKLSPGAMQQGLTESGRGSAGTLWRRFGVNMVVVEIATAMVLLVGAGLLGKSLYRLLHANVGLEPDHLALLHVAAVGNTYQTDAQQIVLEREVVAQVENLPGVMSLGLTNLLPLGDGDGASSFHRLDRPYLGLNQEVIRRRISPNYFQAIRARILRGRNFSADDRLSKPAVVVISVTLAHQYFPGEDPVGKRIAWDGDPKSSSIEIVGVVNDLQEGQLDAAPRAAIYIPCEQSPDSDFFIVARTAQDESTLLLDMTKKIHAIDPSLAVYDATTMATRIHDSPTAYLHRISAWIVGCFAGIALLLSVVGLYGVVAYSVGQRTREIGVRMALGAPRSSVYTMILREAGWLIAIGIALGFAGSLGAATLMRKLLFGTAAWDAGTLAGVAVVLGCAAMLASYIPARRAAAVDPAVALRAE